ncbi:hypothetical protein M406DRAFT_269446 [Cryphonectria parasitica EP155]|uniref:C2H2-type domain-containing protein n=1 Tax=Cryphonectria parasitica (strain ATCC 38755 / EP155) TaxID=660469 RepID=A0A9P4XSI2_CRYP1|nr:uncharacterized protein M406DRAFT_269446 [Cryphonectria parasitica EP155]KAF3760138.1 hypothetical protein M406DRAFT_269446 [Cryphonectria parasitica EP155]
MFPRQGNEEHQFHHSSIYPDPPHGPFSTAPLDMGLTSDASSYYPRMSQDLPTTMTGLENIPFAVDGHAGWPYAGMSPPTFPDDREMAIASNMSTGSGPSAPSSAVGSPRSTHGHPAPIPEWAPQGVTMSPGIVGNHEYFNTGTEYSFAPSGMEDLTSFAYVDTSKPLGYVDPSLINPEIARPLMQPYDGGFQHAPSVQQQQQAAPVYPNSPALTSSSPHVRNGSQSPFLAANAGYHFSPYPVPVDQNRRPSLVSFRSGHSGTYSDTETKEKQRCPHPECGKVFKDLKAHMLTHQTERPEKCPITTCEYHTKGFARKYDKNRHTLTHYKGTMVCGFCPGSGSAAEKSFNRADVFKRHLTAVHGVEQTPPNSRKNKNGAGAAPAGTGKKPGPGYAPDATGKCSTCSQTFSNAQDFYEHLDDCVLRIVQQEDPAEAINARRLAEVENDRDVHQTLEKNNLPTDTQTLVAEDEEDDDDMDDEDGLPYDEQELKAMGVKTSASLIKRKGNPANGVQKSRGLTHSRGGFPKTHNQNKGRKSRREYPSSWGFDKGQMTMKKRVMAVFDGPRRLAKDDMMLSTEHEVRLPLADGRSYVTDLDVQTLRRAEGFLNATDEEKGIWISDDPTEEDLTAMLNHQLQ